MKEPWAKPVFVALIAASLLALVYAASHTRAPRQVQSEYGYKEPFGISDVAAPRNYGLLTKRYREAAELGDAEAQYQLGVHYLRGLGVAPDPEKAFDWFLAAALQGHVPAQVSVARRYAAGAGVGKDDLQAYAWLYLAASSGDPSAIRQRDLMEKSLTESEVALGEVLSRSLYQR